MLNTYIDFATSDVRSVEAAEIPLSLLSVGPGVVLACNMNCKYAGRYTLNAGKVAGRRMRSRNTFFVGRSA